MKKINVFLLLITISLVGCEQQAKQAEQEGNLDGIILQQDPGPYSCNLEQLGIDQNLGSPTSIADVVELINVLPRPLNIPCFLSSLNRPLKVNLTNSGTSAQPAKGDDSPRIFIMNDPLVMSISVEGGGSIFIEFAEFTTDLKSIKGELKFPITDQIVDISEPFKSVESNSGSKCAACHIQEERVVDSQYPGSIYESMALKPLSSQNVNVSDFKLESYKCDLLVQPDNRCQMIYALYNNGEVIFEDFPQATLTFFDSFGL